MTIINVGEGRGKRMTIINVGAYLTFKSFFFIRPSICLMPIVKSRSNTFLETTSIECVLMILYFPTYFRNGPALSVKRKTQNTWYAFPYFSAKPLTRGLIGKIQAKCTAKQGQIFEPLIFVKTFYQNIRQNLLPGKV